MAEPLIYSNNVELKYPLSDLHEEDIPTDILMNLSISISDGIIPVLGGVRIDSNFVFISIERQGTREPVATILVEDPQLARVYPMDMGVPGFGWVSFGPGALEGNEFTFEGEVAIDAECVAPIKQTLPTYHLSINGLLASVTNILSVLSANSNLVLSVSEEDDVFNTVYIDRNDSVFSADDLIALTAGADSETSISNSQVIFTIGGVSPDENGNIDIDIDDCIDPCEDNRDFEVPRGDTGIGEAGELPLDILSPREFEEGDPCAEPAPSQVPDEDPFSGCNDTEKVDIIDVGNNDKAIGTLYTLDSYTGTEE